MSGISNRVFGADIRPEIKRKLTARQEFAKTANPLKSITAESDMQQMVYNVDYRDNQTNFGGLADLSSRTPFVRMWTAVELFKPAKEEDDPNTKDIDESKEQIFETQIYEVGNHIYNTFQEEGNPLDTRTGNSSGIAEHIIPNVQETNKNEFMRPPTGITSLNSSTEGSLGLTKITTVNFTVHNFHDFDKIYNRYFLRPGAQIFVDFGWDTSKLYIPQNIITSTGRSGLEDTFKDRSSVNGVLFGEGGYVTDSHGDLETLSGRVTNYDAKIKANGSVECSVEIVSQNSALMKADFGEDNVLKKRIVFSLENEIAQFAAGQYATGSKVSDEDKKFANALANAQWQNSSIEDQKVENAIFTRFINSNLKSDKGYPLSSSLETGVYQAGKNENKRSWYVSWAVLEDVILSNEFGFSESEDTILSDGDAITFDSGNSLVRWSHTLFENQKNNLLDRASRFNFVYPNDPTNIKNTYNMESKRTTIEEHKWKNVSLGNDSIIPLREIFISLDLVRNAIDKSDNVSQIMNYIIDSVNKSSNGVFDLTLGTNSYDHKTISVIDKNLVFFEAAIKETEGPADDNFEKLFMFHPTSPNSIVKSYDISFTMPKNDMGNMIAIQASSGTGGGIPLSQTISRLKDMDILNDNISEDFQTRYLPRIGSHVGSHLNTSNADKKESVGIDLKYSQHDGVNVDESTAGVKNTLDSIAGFDPDQKEAVIGSISGDESLSGASWLGLGDPSLGRNLEQDNLDALSEEVNYGSIVVDSLDDYYGTKSSSEAYSTNISTLLPVTLTLSIYGISSLMPGDIFRVDYLPEIYRENVYFQIMKVTHNISPSTWTVQLETQMRIRSIKKKEVDIGIKEVVLNKSVLTKSNSDANISGNNNHWNRMIYNMKKNMIRLKPSAAIETKWKTLVKVLTFTTPDTLVGETGQKIIQHSHYNLNASIFTDESGKITLGAVKSLINISPFQSAPGMIWKLKHSHKFLIDGEPTKEKLWPSPTELKANLSRHFDAEISGHSERTAAYNKVGHKLDMTSYFAYTCTIVANKTYYILHLGPHWVCLPTEVYSAAATIYANILTAVSVTNQTSIEEEKALISGWKGALPPPSPTGEGDANKIMACFIAGTKISMYDGSKKNIENVKKGDIVLSFNDGKYVKGTITEHLIHPINKIDTVAILEDLVGEPHHPIYKNGKWIEMRRSGNVSFEQRYVDNYYNLEIDGDDIYGSEHNYIADNQIVSGLGDDEILNDVYQRQDVFKKELV